MAVVVDDDETRTRRRSERGGGEDTPLALEFGQLERHPCLLQKIYARYTAQPRFTLCPT